MAVTHVNQAHACIAFDSFSVTCAVAAEEAEQNGITDLVGGGQRFFGPNVVLFRHQLGIRHDGSVAVENKTLATELACSFIEHR